jgi:hypothetical protein
VLSYDSAWFQRLKFKCDKLVSNFAFIFYLRRYIEEEARKLAAGEALKALAAQNGALIQVGRCKLTLSNSR